MQVRLTQRFAVLVLLACPIGCSQTPRQVARLFGERSEDHTVAAAPLQEPIATEAPKSRAAATRRSEPLDLANYTAPEELSEPAPSASNNPKRSSAASSDGSNSFDLFHPERSLTSHATQTAQRTMAEPPASETHDGSRFARAEDYSWVQGRLEFRHRTHDWRVRYAPHWREERFGGSLVLQRDEADPSWQDGAWVRLYGALGDSADGGPGQVYVVEHTEVLRPSRGD